MTVTDSPTLAEVTCRNDARAQSGDRVVVLEWSDPIRGTHGRAAVPVGCEDVHMALLAGPSGSVVVYRMGTGTVGRVIQWLHFGRDGIGQVRFPARVVVTLE